MSSEMNSQLSPQQTADLVRERMHASDRATQSLGMRIVSVTPGAAELEMTVRVR